MPEADVPQHVVPAGAVAQVVPDLLLRREGARPARVGLEGERVEMRGHVARATRVGVVAPGAANVIGALQDDEVLDAVATQGDGHAQAAEAAADDGDADVRSPPPPACRTSR